MKKGIFMVMVNCTDPSREEEFNRWYTHTHLPDLSRTKGMVKARRFKHLRSGRGEPAKYVTIYEFEAENLDDSMKDFMKYVEEAHATGRHIDCLDVKGVHLYEEIDPESLKPLAKVNYPKERPDSLPTPEW
jgi:hypothetical protein